MIGPLLSAAASMLSSTGMVSSIRAMELTPGQITKSGRLSVVVNILGDDILFALKVWWRQMFCVWATVQI